MCSYLVQIVSVRPTKRRTTKDQPVGPAPKTSQHRRRRSRTVIVGSSVEAGALSWKEPATRFPKILTESVIGLDFEKLRPSWRVRNWDGVEKSETEETELAEGQISQDEVVDGGGGALRGNPRGSCRCPCALPCRYKRSFSGLSFWPMMKIRQENEHNNRSVWAWGLNGS